MRQSQHLGITLKNAPREAQTDGHKLLVRAGYIRQAAPGIHVVMTYLLRVLNKLERICRAELAAASFEEFALPLLVPAAFRQAPEAAGMGNEPETGLFTFKDRRGSVLSIGSGSAGMLVNGPRSCELAPAEHPYCVMELVSPALLGEA
jgi:prolyl-tRNA synthetase